MKYYYLLSFWCRPNKLHKALEQVVIYFGKDIADINISQSPFEPGFYIRVYHTNEDQKDAFTQYVMQRLYVSKEHGVEQTISNILIPTK